MQFLKNILSFYVFSNIHVAFAGFCMTKITLLTYGSNSNVTSLFVAFSIIVSYNFIRFYEIKTNRLGWLKNWFLLHKKPLFVLCVFSLIGIAYLLFFEKFNLKSLFILFPFALMTFFYVIPLFKVNEMEGSFRNFPGIKIFSISVAWAGVTVLFPLYEMGKEIDFSAYIEFLQRILILIAITMPFDIRDVNSDAKGLKTMPQVLGVRNTKLIGFVLLLFFVLLSFFQQNNVEVNSGIALVTGLFLWFSSPEKSRFYAGFWVEAIPVFWLLLIVLFLKN